jgi:hypothetical protein
MGEPELNRTVRLRIEIGHGDRENGESRRMGVAEYCL